MIIANPPTHRNIANPPIQRKVEMYLKLRTDTRAFEPRFVADDAKAKPFELRPGCSCIECRDAREAFAIRALAGTTPTRSA